jgi:hypothetical protein
MADAGVVFWSDSNPTCHSAVIGAGGRVGLQAGFVGQWEYEATTTRSRNATSGADRLAGLAQYGSYICDSRWDGQDLITTPTPFYHPVAATLVLRNFTPPDTPVRLHGYNYNLSSCYPRRMADFNRNGMLFSSGDSPNSSAILSGDGLDEE